MLNRFRTSMLALALACALPGVASAADAAPAPELIARGKYLAVAGDCAACHTQSGKAAYSGGLAIDSPLGKIFATNITPSAKAGIGGYTLAQFEHAVRLGKRADGNQLYPAMPYTAYAKLSDDDVAALYAYFMHGVAADETASPATRLPFPFNLRFSMALWNALYLDTRPFTPVKGQSVEWNRGAYLVAGLAHCSTCHTPRNFLMAEQTDQFLRGASLGTWYAPDITQNKGDGIGSWDQQAIVQYLMTGHAHNGATAGGPMLEAIDKSFSKMAPQDIQAIATYLRSLPAEQKETTPAPPVAAVSGSDITEMAGQIRPGEQLYRDNCASCHQNSGDGQRGLPALRNHPLLRYPNADNVAMAILQGVWPEQGQGMPGFAGELNDQQIADISNYLVTDFGHGKARIDAQRVGALRHGGETSPLLPLARGGMAAGLLALLVLLVLLFWWWRRKKS
jgi:mono/diheme cytochrome c family protein